MRMYWHVYSLGGEGQQQSQTADILPNQAHSFYGTHAIYHSAHLVSTL